MGTNEGSIIATIIRTHIATNETAEPHQVCPGMRIHVMDIDQPPGIDISPIADMEAHHTIDNSAVTTNTKADVPTNAR
jgi:hypothetical protein